MTHCAGGRGAENTYDYSIDVGNLHVIDQYLHLTQLFFTRVGQSSRPAVQRDYDEEQSGAYR